MLLLCKDIGLQLGTLLKITFLHKCLLHFIRLIIPNRETHQIHRIFGLKTKCSITIHAFSLRYQHSYISAWLAIIHYISHWFTHLFLYIICVMIAVGMWKENFRGKMVCSLNRLYLRHKPGPRFRIKKNG